MGSLRYHGKQTKQPLAYFQGLQQHLMRCVDLNAEWEAVYLVAATLPMPILIMGAAGVHANKM